MPIDKEAVLEMAEAWARHLFPDGWEAASCGVITYRITDLNFTPDGEYPIVLRAQDPGCGVAADSLLVTRRRP